MYIQQCFGDLCELFVIWGLGCCCELSVILDFGDSCEPSVMWGLGIAVNCLSS